MSADNPYSSPTDLQPPMAEGLQLEVPQTVSFHLTEDELVALTLRIHEHLGTYQRHIRVRQRRLFAIGFALGLLSVLYYLSEIGDGLLPFFMASFGVALVIGALRLPASTRKFSEKFTRDSLAAESSELLDREFRATLLAEGFQMADQHGHGFRKWQAVPKLDRRDDMLLVYVTGTTAHGIPSRAFLNEQTYNAFCDLAERLWREAHPDDNSMQPPTD